MTNTPPPRNDQSRDDGAPEANGETETPVFDDVATEHPEVQDAAPELIEPAVAPEQGAGDAPDFIEPETAATPEREAAPVPLVEPAEPESRPIETAIPVQEAPSELPETAGYDEHIDEPEVVEERSAPVVAPPVAPAQRVQTVYVSAPVEPKKKGNRGFGVLLAILGTLVFAILFVAVIGLFFLLVRPERAFGGSILGFIGSSAFWVPVAVYLVVFVLFALILNRGNWVAWVLTSFLLAVVVYFASIGVILLFEGVLGMTPTEASDSFGKLALSAPLIVAAILAREVTIWFGAAIAARGSKVKERNLEARAAYERELDNQPLGFS